ncbi:SRPBCC family protein [Rhodococcus sp. IEGM 1379]|uniref:SRPBCC family protein n=1 Tax=Rhodococcus sp. IEGM 1379 TaxID=3047086 RepID=UPI0024B86CFE|nr:SRPBCC family protein [Rhodococcus sp. IEGM 1379]MDI9917598.1 SRPBCC family protein [Rhodococcus sp. IEGM 1379]
MKIAHEFTVNAPVEQAWTTLTDLEGIAPLLPGAQMTGREGDQFLGKVTIKVGPVLSEFAGRAKFVEKDEATHRAVIDARGRESRGSGNASAVITAQLYREGAQTRVSVDTDVKIVGKLAQFGSSMITQVSEKLMGEFAASLELKLAGPPEAAVPLVLEPQVVEPLDVIELAGGSVAKRALPVLAAAAMAIVVFVLWRRRGR